MSSDTSTHIDREGFALASFWEAIASMGIPERELRVESIDRGANNVATNVNCGGVTWAVAVRAPVDGEGTKFAVQKVRTAAVTQYLAGIFAHGIPLVDGSRFVFDGVSALTDPSSTSDFFKVQAKRSPLRIRDAFRPEHEVEELIPVAESKFDLTYKGPYFVSKGAPAVETLMDDTSFADVMIRGLAALHVWTGASSQSSKRSLIDGMLSIESELKSFVESWEASPGTSSGARIHKYQSKFGVNNGIRAEVFLQTDAGRKLIGDRVGFHFQEMMNAVGLRAFIHGDAHGRNFIVVQFGYTVLSGKGAFLDRAYINDLFAEFSDLNELTVETSHEGNLVIYRPFRVGDQSDQRCSIVVRASRNDVHLIDPDTGRGIEESEKECYLFDLVTLCLSIRNWCRIHAEPVRAFEDLIDVYGGEFENQLIARRVYRSFQ